MRNEGEKIMDDALYFGLNEIKGVSALKQSKVYFCFQEIIKLGAIF